MKLSTMAAGIVVLLTSSFVHAETITFDDLALGAAPSGFTVGLTGRGGPPKWVVQKAPNSEPGNVVAQVSAEGVDNRFPVLVYDKFAALDVDMSVRFQTVSGSVDQAAGLVWRYKDAKNYYIVRANALEDNVVLYKVENGVRSDLALKGKGKTYGAKAPVLKKAWNVLAVQVRGQTFSVSMNGAPLYDVEDRTFPEPGKMGLWTKADSVTLFDDLTINVVK